MSQYAVLLGSAPEGKIQKKIDSTYDSLVQESAALYSESEIMIFPNGIDEANLICFLNDLRMNGINRIFLYICTVTPVSDYEKTVWLGGNEIRKSVFEKPASLAEYILVNGGESLPEEKCSVQVVYDFDREFIDGSAYFYDAQDDFRCKEIEVKSC